jgi:hypothetical protein
MSIPSSQAAAGWAKDALRSDGWVSLDSVLARAVAEKWLGKSEAEVAEYVEENLRFVAEHLRTESSEASYDGAICTFEIDNEEYPYIRRIESGSDLLLSKLKMICPFEFENVCARLLTELGGESFVTAKTGDGGVDFISTGIDILPPLINSPMHCRATVIGQAKRYKDRLVAEKALREFIGASLLQRNDLRVARKIFPLSPVLLAFWSTSNFDPNCKDFARRAGVWLMDGHTLSSYLGKLGLSDWVMSLAEVD